MRPSTLLRLTLLATLVAGPAGAAPPEAGDTRILPTPPAAATREAVRRWHRETAGRIAPLVREWRSLNRLMGRRPGRRLLAGCRDLQRALGELRHQRLPVAPDPSISLHLERALRSLDEAATSCTHGAYFLASWRLRQADEAWRELNGRLRLYQPAP